MKIEIILCLITTIVYIVAGVYFRVKKPYESASNHRFMILTLSYVIAMIYAIERYAHFKQYADCIFHVFENSCAGSGVEEGKYALCHVLFSAGWYGPWISVHGTLPAL